MIEGQLLFCVKNLMSAFCLIKWSRNFAKSANDYFYSNL